MMTFSNLAVNSVNLSMAQSSAQQQISSSSTSGDATSDPFTSEAFNVSIGQEDTGFGGYNAQGEIADKVVTNTLNTLNSGALGSNGMSNSYNLSSQVLGAYLG
jgi:hypothetical protein